MFDLDTAVGLLRGFTALAVGFRCKSSIKIFSEFKRVLDFIHSENSKTSVYWLKSIFPLVPSSGQLFDDPAGVPCHSISLLEPPPTAFVSVFMLCGG